MASDPARTHPSEFPVLALRETVVLPREEMSDAQRQYFLRQQLKAVQDELGEGDTPEAQELRRRNAIREKALAARRYGITTFVPPARHEPDLAEPVGYHDGHSI